MHRTEEDRVLAGLHSNLGALLMSSGRLDEAIAHMDLSLSYAHRESRNDDTVAGSPHDLYSDIKIAKRQKKRPRASDIID